MSFSSAIAGVRLSAAGQSRLRRLALVFPLLLMLAWIGWTETRNLDLMRREIRNEALRAADNLAGVIANRLNAQFTELEFTATLLLGSAADPSHPDTVATQALHRLMRLHPNLWAFNIQSADGKTILWSTRIQSARPVAPPEQFTPLPSRPEFLLGPALYAERMGTHIIAMRYRVGDAQGRTAFFVGSPYRLEALLRPASPKADTLPWIFEVRDTRSGAVAGWIRHASVNFIPPAAPLHSQQSAGQVSVPGYPLHIDAFWPAGLAWHRYLQSALPRWAFEIASLILLALAGGWISRLMQQREHQIHLTQRLSDFQDYLAQVNQAAVDAVDTQTFLRTVCELGLERARLDRVRILRFTGEEAHACTTMAEAPRSQQRSAAAQTDADGWAPCLFPVTARHADKPLFNLSGAVFGSSPSATPSAFVSANAILPLECRGERHVLLLSAADARAFEAPVQAVLRALAADVARGLEAIAQRRQLAQLQTLYRALLEEASLLLAVPTESESELLEKTCRSLIRNTRFHVVWIGRPEDSGRFKILALAGPGQAQVKAQPPRLSKEPPQSIVVRAWQQRDIVVCNDTRSDEGLAPWHEGFARHQWASLLAVPVFRGGHRWAVMAFVSTRINTFDAPTVELCRRITELLGHGLDEMDLRARLLEQQRNEAHRARHDLLTDLPNRLALEEYLPRALGRARRTGTALAVGLLDLDDFKPVNDRFGHEAGDRLLKQLAERFTACLRDTDFLSRLGGDEFVLVFENLAPSAVMEELEGILSRLHQAVESAFELGPERTATVGLTLGLALFPEDGDTADALLRKADAAMYRAKARKTSRKRWWALGPGHVPTSNEDEPVAKDPFGAAAATLLRATLHSLESVSDRIVEQWYDDLQNQQETAATLDTLTPDELVSLKSKQAAHLRCVLAPDTRPQDIAAVGHATGRIHALVGVSADLMIGFMEHFEALLRREWAESHPAQRLQLGEILSARLNADLRAQLRGHDEVLSIVNAHLRRPLHAAGAPEAWIDTVRQELLEIAALPGIVVAAVLQPDDKGRFRALLSSGEKALAVIHHLERSQIQPLLAPDSPRGRGNLADVWHGGQRRVVAALAKDPRQAPWHALQKRLGLRSEVAIPLKDSRGHVEAVLLLIGGYPGQFAAAWHHALLDAFQSRWNALWQRRHPAPSLNLRQADIRLRRESLFSGGLEMWMQPVVDLRRGALAKVEALARLRMPSGERLGPGGFLPLLGERDLRWMFDAGFEQALASLEGWQDEGLRPELSINLPPTKLLDIESTAHILPRLQAAGIAPGRITLELLETEDLFSQVQRAALDRLAQQGLKLAIDDLGSGYSSLLRLGELPVATLKIDQGLVRHLAADPLRRLPLIGILLDLGVQLGIETVIEGLEDAALLEMAVQLGADHGQGYVLARPMPAADIPGWAASFCLHADPARLHTALGAMAYLLRDRCQTCALRDCPLTPFLSARNLTGISLTRAHAALHARHGIEAARRILMEALARQARREAQLADAS